MNFLDPKRSSKAVAPGSIPAEKDVVCTYMDKTKLSLSGFKLMQCSTNKYKNPVKVSFSLLTAQSALSYQHTAESIPKDTFLRLFGRSPA